MTDQKKFLDAEGVKYLWSKLSLQDYPNNETLMDVIEAIDETKADKSEIIPSDWNQNDETAADYIKNRTHYDCTRIEVNERCPFGSWVYGNLKLTEILNSGSDLSNITAIIYREFRDGSTEVLIESPLTYVDGFWKIGEYYFAGLSDIDHGAYVLDPSLPDGNVSGYVEFTGYYEEGSLKQLDEKFIPNTIARVSDVVQSDWEQNDETAADYVKNRTHYEDVVNVVALQEVTSSTFYDEPNGRYFFAPNCIFIEGVNAGETYNVHFNRLKYECTAKQEGRQIILGNESIIGLAENNGLPFIIIIPDGVNKGITLYTTELVESVTIKITKTIEKTVHQLDEKYIPIATDDEIISMLLELDMLPAIIDSDGSMLSDENGNILLW